MNYQDFWSKLRLCVVALFAIVVVEGARAIPAAAQNVQSYNLDTFKQWLAKYKDAKPEFKPGDVLTAKDIEKMRPFVIPGYLEQLNFPEFRMPIIEARDHTPRKDYVACTEKYQAQVKLKKDDTLENYVCGQPFPNSSLSVNDPRSGIKAAWNFEYRWQNYGYFAEDYVGSLVRFGDAKQSGDVPTKILLPPENWVSGVGFTSKLPEDLTPFFKGGGFYQRTLAAAYQRVYFSHLAQLQDKGGVLPMTGAKEFEFKEFTGFFHPFDIRGTAFIVWRYSDPYRADQAWAYVPELRRVRRVSAEVKSDSLMGTDHTIEDFYSFAGRAVEWNWQFLGWKDLLCPFDSKWDVAHVYGPNPTVVDDRWEVRRFAVILRTPKRPRHPYSAVLNFWDSQNWDSWWEVAFDRKGKLWKIWIYPKEWSEDVKNFAEINHGTRVTVFQTVDVMDLQNQRGTVNVGLGNGYPTPTLQHMRIFDVNRLEEIHR